jgi:hypothetical protein
MRKGKAMSKLKQLRRELPKEFTEEHPGFHGNISGSDMFITDGHVCLLRSAVNLKLAEAIEEFHGYYSKKPTETRILEMWELVEQRTEVPCHFIGCAKIARRNDDSYCVVAILRDISNRVLIVSPYILAWSILHVKPDTMRMAFTPMHYDFPLSLIKDEKMVGVIMPMRYYKDDVSDYDLTGEPVGLEELA